MAESLRQLVGIEAPIVFGIGPDSTIQGGKTIDALMVDTLTGTEIAGSRSSISLESGPFDDEILNNNPITLNDIEYAKTQITALGKIGLIYGDPISLE